MRRNDYDVTDRIQTTLVSPVREEVVRVYRALYDADSAQPLERAFEVIERSYAGRDPQYHACDTAYHDIQHILDVTLAMARLMDGYERGRREGAEALPPALYRLGVVTALFHDFGYLRRRSDRRHSHGAEYTLTHVSRGSRYLHDLVNKTPGFYINARKRLDLQLARAYDYAERHFRGQNLYLEEMEKNVRHAQIMAAENDPDLLRRTPPYTLLGESEPVPEGFVIR